jgi:hypothetical protein
MDREYDIFERLEDGSTLWRDAVNGLENALLKLEEVAKKTTNECFAMHLPTQEIIASAGGSKQSSEIG